MPKATLTFDLLKENAEHRMALEGPLYCAVIHQLDLWLRNLVKYESRDIVETKEVREKITELMSKYGISESN